MIEQFPSIIIESENHASDLKGASHAQKQVLSEIYLFIAREMDKYNKDCKTVLETKIGLMVHELHDSIIHIDKKNHVTNDPLDVFQSLKTFGILTIFDYPLNNPGE